MVELSNVLTPFLTRTSAIMTAVIILIIIGAYLVSTEKKINRATVEKFILLIAISVLSLIVLEIIITLAPTFKQLIRVRYK